MILGLVILVYKLNPDIMVVTVAPRVRFVAENTVVEIIGREIILFVERGGITFVVSVAVASPE